MTSRRKFSPEFKKRVSLEAIQERETLSTLAQKYNLHPQQITNWKSHFIANAASVFERADKRASKEEALTKERAELMRTIGEQKVQIDYLKKKLI